MISTVPIHDSVLKKNQNCTERSDKIQFKSEHHVRSNFVPPLFPVNSVSVFFCYTNKNCTYMACIVCEKNYSHWLNKCKQNWKKIIYLLDFSPTWWFRFGNKCTNKQHFDLNPMVITYLFYLVAIHEFQWIASSTNFCHVPFGFYTSYTLKLVLLLLAKSFRLCVHVCWL